MMNKIRAWRLACTAIAVLMVAGAAAGQSGGTSCLSYKLDAMTGISLTPGAAFGDGVAIEGDTAIVGAEFHNMGAAFIFQRTGTCWILVKELSGTTTGSRFGHSVAVHGDTILVSEVGDGSAGMVHVLSRDSGGLGNWGPHTTVPQIGGFGGGFGHSLSMSDDTIVVTAPQASPSGAAYIYDFSGSSIVLAATYSVSGIIQFGSYGDVEGDVIVIGATNNSLAEGASYVFERTGGGWAGAVVTELLASDGAVIDAFGNRVGISNGTIVVGAPHHNSFRGAAYVYERTALDVWPEIAKLTASNATDGDILGYPDISGGVIVIGAPKHAPSGSVYMYVRNSLGTWGPTENFELTACDAGGDDWFGQSVSLDNGSLLVGARTDDPDGAAYVYSLQCGSLVYGDLDGNGVVEPTDLQILHGILGNACYSVDSNVDGTVNVTDLLALLAAWGVCPKP